MIMTNVLSFKRGIDWPGADRLRGGPKEADQLSSPVDTCPESGTVCVMMSKTSVVQASQIERSILLVRGEKVMLDEVLAHLYQVPTKALLQAVKRNIERFPADFMFQLNGEEWASLRSQIVTSKGRGGRRYPPYVFTEQGVAMLSSVLRSNRAVQVNIEIMRAFVRLRQILASHAVLARKLAELERKYDTKFKIVFDAIRELMEPPAKKRQPIGFLPPEVKGKKR